MRSSCCRAAAGPRVGETAAARFDRAAYLLGVKEHLHRTARGASNAAELQREITATVQSADLQKGRAAWTERWRPKFALIPRKLLGVIHHSVQACPRTNLRFGKRCQGMGGSPINFEKELPDRANAAMPATAELTSASGLNIQSNGVREISVSPVRGMHKRLGQRVRMLSPASFNRSECHTSANNAFPTRASFRHPGCSRPKS